MANIIEYFSVGQDGRPDLGWLIQNGQVSDGELCSILLDDYASRLSWLAFLLTRSPIEMADVIHQTTIQAIYNRKNYPGDVPGKTWLWGLAIKECLRLRRFTGYRRTGAAEQVLEVFAPGGYFTGHTSELYNSLGKRNGLLLLFHFGFNLSADEIAYLLALPLDQVHADLNAIKGMLAEHQASCATCQILPGGIMDVVALLMKAIQSSKPSMEYNQPTRARWVASIMEQAASLHNRAETRSRRMQGMQAGGLLVVLCLSIWLIVRQPRKPLPALVLISPTTSAIKYTVTPIPTTHPKPTQVPTNSNIAIPTPTPDISTILNLAKASMTHWESIWADVEVIRYDPSASSAGTQVTRKQVWVGQPYSARVISGPVDGEPALTTTKINNRFTSQNFQNGQTIRTFSSDLITDLDLQKLFIPQSMLIPGGSYQYVGSDRIATRAVWILDRYDGGDLTDTLAVDMRYGVIVYRREYGGKDRKTILKDTEIKSIVFNPPVSPSIYEPDMYLGDHYANDFSGTPDIYNVQDALAVWTSPSISSQNGQQPNQPPLNPSISELTFLNPASIEATTGLDLFANGRFLGQLPVGGSSIMTCERSPDGSTIAYNSEGRGATGDTALYLAKLSTIQTTYRVMPDGFTAGDYAFSPDGQRLAFFGCDKAKGFCGLMILDTNTGKVNQMVQLEYADYMIWKPDGRYLALVGVQDSSALIDQLSTQNLLMNEVQAITQPWHFYVFDISDGSLVFKQPFQWSLLSAPLDSPTNSWNVPFKNQPGGIEGCTNPPVQK